MMGRLISLFLCAATGIFSFAIFEGVTGSIMAAVVAAVIVAAGVFAWLLKHPVIQLESDACSRTVKTLAVVAAIIGLLQLIRLTVFMVDPSKVQFSFLPSSKWEIQHSCLSAYFIAGQNAKTSAIYDDELYSLPGNPNSPRNPRMLGPFRIDVYEYPPPFLLLPVALQFVTPDFSSLRILWFGLNCMLLLSVICMVARFLGPVAGTRALLLSTLVWAAIPTISTLQKGNVQLVILAISMAAMVMFEKRRFAGGGILLAFATVSKLYPGLLVLYLLARRKWRAAFWTMSFGVVFTLVTLAYTGWAPFEAFRNHLPLLLSGESFPALRNPAATAINLSMPGIIFKLKLFGVPGMGFPAARIVGWMYTIIAIGAVVFAARLSQREEDKPLVWLSLLILATLRSPFLPQTYGIFPAVWALTLGATLHRSIAKSVPWIVATWLVFNIYWPTDWPMDPRLLVMINAVPQATMIVIAIASLKRLPQEQQDSLILQDVVPIVATET